MSFTLFHNRRINQQMLLKYHKMDDSWCGRSAEIEFLIPNHLEISNCQLATVGPRGEEEQLICKNL
jgi:hypothetical protein